MCCGYDPDDELTSDTEEETPAEEIPAEEVPAEEMPPEEVADVAVAEETNDIPPGSDKLKNDQLTQRILEGIDKINALSGGDPDALKKKQEQAQKILGQSHSSETPPDTPSESTATQEDDDDDVVDDDEKGKSTSDDAAETPVEVSPPPPKAEDADPDATKKAELPSSEDPKKVSPPAPSSNPPDPNAKSTVVSPSVVPVSTGGSPVVVQPPPKDDEKAEVPPVGDPKKLSPPAPSSNPPDPNAKSTVVSSSVVPVSTGGSPVVVQPPPKDDDADLDDEKAEVPPVGDPKKVSPPAPSSNPPDPNAKSTVVSPSVVPVSTGGSPVVVQPPPKDDEKAEVPPVRDPKKVSPPAPSSNPPDPGTGSRVVPPPVVPASTGNSSTVSSSSLSGVRRADSGVSSVVSGVAGGVSPVTDSSGSVASSGSGASGLPQTKDQWKQYIIALRGEKNEILKDVLVDKYKAMKQVGIFTEEDDDDDDDDGSGGGGSDSDSDDIAAIPQARQDFNDDRALHSMVTNVYGNHHSSGSDTDDDSDLIGNRAGGNNAQQAGSKSDGGSSILDGITKWIGVYNDLESITTFGSMVTTLEATDVSKARKKELKEDPDHIRTAQAHGYLDLIGEVGSLTGDVLTIISNQKKANRTKSKRRKTELKVSNAKSVISALADMGKISKTGINLWGDVDNDTSQEGGVEALSVINPFISFCGNMVGLFGGISDSRERKQMALEMRAAVPSNGDMTEDQQRNLLKRLKKRAAVRGKRYQKALKRYSNAFKARKYSMQQAADFNELYADKKLMGLIGSITTGLTLVSNIVQLIPGIGEIATGVLKALTPFLSSGASVVGKYVEQSWQADKEQEAIEKRRSTLKDYLEEKRPDVEKQAAEAFAGRGDKANLVPETQESYKIALARLGVDTEIDTNDITGDKVKEGFEALNKKRARYIMESDDHSREEFFSMMRLEDGATLEDVEKALTGI